MKIKIVINSILIGILIGLPIAIVGGISQLNRVEIMPKTHRVIETVHEVHTEKAPLEKTTAEIDTVAPEQPYPVYDFIPLSAELQEYVCEVAEGYGICPMVVYALMWKESRFDTEALNITNKEHSVGLMQVNLMWHQTRMYKLGITNAADPKQNILLGIDYLAELMTYEDRNNNTLEWVLMAYNAGPTGADELTAQGTVTEYAKSVMDKLLEYSEVEE